MSTTDTDVQNLVVNKLTLSKYTELKKAGTVSATESYEITDIDSKILDFYGTCTTAAGTQAKVVTCPGFILQEGISIRVKFTNNQDYNGVPTLNVNGTGAKNIVSKSGTNAFRYCWMAGEVVAFTYDGTNWIMQDGGIATTTYYGTTRLQTSTTSTSTSLAATPASINNLVQNMIEPYDIYSTSSTYAIGDRVRYNNNAWECNTAISTAEAWTQAHWTMLDPIQIQLDDKQETLTSGTNIKTINGNSILGSGNLIIEGTGGNATWGSINGTISNQTDLVHSVAGAINSYCATNGSTNDKPYKKIAEWILTGTYQSVIVPFLYCFTNVDAASALYLGKINSRVDATAGTSSQATSNIVLETFPIDIQNEKITFYLLSKNNTPSADSVTYQLWIYINNTYRGVAILPLRQGTGGSGYNISNITWGNNLVEASALPSEYVAKSQTLASLHALTPTTSDNSTNVATTAFVKNQGYLSTMTYDSSTETLAWS